MRIPPDWVWHMTIEIFVDPGVEDLRMNQIADAGEKDLGHDPKNNVEGNADQRIRIKLNRQGAAIIRQQFVIVKRGAE